MLKQSLMGGIVPRTANSLKMDFKACFTKWQSLAQARLQIRLKRPELYRSWTDHGATGGLDRQQVTQRHTPQQRQMPICTTSLV